MTPSLMLSSCQNNKHQDCYSDEQQLLFCFIFLDSSLTLRPCLIQKHDWLERQEQDCPLSPRLNLGLLCCTPLKLKKQHPWSNLQGSQKGQLMGLMEAHGHRATVRTQEAHSVVSIWTKPPGVSKQQSAYLSSFLPTRGAQKGKILGL